MNKEKILISACLMGAKCRYSEIKRKGLPVNKKNRLVVYFDKKNTRLAQFTMLAIIVALFIVLSFFSKANIVFFPGFPFLNLLTSTAIKVFIYGVIAFFAFGAIYSYFVMIEKRPVVILNQMGIWIKHYNFIPWKDIEILTSYPIAGTLEGLGIVVKNPKKLSKQSNIHGKLSMFWAKLFNSYHATLSNIDTPNEEIISFYQQHKNPEK